MSCIFCSNNMETRVSSLHYIKKHQKILIIAVLSGGRLDEINMSPVPMIENCPKVGRLPK